MEAVGTPEVEEAAMTVAVPAEEAEETLAAVGAEVTEKEEEDFDTRNLGV